MGVEVSVAVGRRVAVGEGAAVEVGSSVGVEGEALTVIPQAFSASVKITKINQ
jgi:hypothetical protein